jgi:hypothetical protein
MNTRVLLSALACVASVTSIIAAGPLPPGGNVVRVLRWSEVPTPPEASVNRAGYDGADTLLIKHTEAKPAKIALWNVENPGVKTKAYAVRGKVRYNNVVGISYLETWNEFPGGSEPNEPKMRAFSRALAEDGPFSKMSGTSDWRDVFIPFNAEGAKEPLAKLELNVVLAGAGEVEITELQLIEFADAGAMWAAVGPGMVKANPAVAWVRWFSGGTVIALIIGAVLAPWAIITFQRRRAEQRRMRALDV